LKKTGESRKGGAHPLKQKGCLKKKDWIWVKKEKDRGKVKGKKKNFQRGRIRKTPTRLSKSILWGKT